MEAERPKVVEVEWIDHSYAEAAEDAHLYHRYSVGYLLSEEDGFIKVALCWDLEEKEDAKPVFEHVMTIGKGMVVRVTQLENHNHAPKTKSPRTFKVTS